MLKLYITESSILDEALADINLYSSDEEPIYIKDKGFVN
jgi:hypothetical protein